MLGDGKITEARNSAFFYIVFTIGLGLILMVTMMLSTEIIANFYSPLEEIKLWMRGILYVFSIGIVGSMLIANQNTLMRVVGKTHLVIGVMMVNFIGIGGLMSVAFGFWMGMGVVGFVLSLGLASWITNFVFYRIVMKLDWESVKIDK